MLLSRADSVEVDPQRGGRGPVGCVVVELGRVHAARNPSEVLSIDLIDDTAHRAEVHQATGIVAVQLGVDVAEALVRVRAYAYAHDRQVAAVAGDIVARRLQLISDRPRQEPS